VLVVESEAKADIRLLGGGVVGRLEVAPPTPLTKRPNGAGKVLNLNSAALARLSML
jgi:hypothetical protein